MSDTSSLAMSATTNPSAGHGGGGSATSTTATTVLPPIVVRGLSDKLYDKRKVAALEVEKFVRDLVLVQSQTNQLVPNHPIPQVVHLIRFLADDFLSTATSNMRNGGLIGLAGVSIALGADLMPPHVDLVVPPVLACFNDTDSRVRYYACESLYNIAKVARHHVLPYFPQLFDALSKLCADTDMSVISGAQLLDRLLKDIITEQKSTHVTSSSTFTLFSLPDFFNLLQERIHTLNPQTRSFLVAWLSVLDSVPGVELVSSIHVFLQGLLKFLTDDSEDVRVATSNLLAELLREISEAVDVQRRLGIGFGALERRIYGDSLDRVDLGAREAEAGNWVPAQNVQLDFPRMFALLLPFLEANPTASAAAGSAGIGGGTAGGASGPGSVVGSTGTTAVGGAGGAGGSGLGISGLGNNINNLTLGPGGSAGPGGLGNTGMGGNGGQGAGGIAGLPGHLPLGLGLSAFPTTTPSSTTSPSQEVRVTCLQWINEFILLARQIMLPYTADILRQVLPAIAAMDLGMQATAATTNSLLFTLIDESDLVATSADAMTRLDLAGVLRTVLALCENMANETRKGCLDWLLMLHKKSPAYVLGFPNLLPGVFRLLSDPSEDVVKRALQLVAQVSSYSEGHQFDALMADILRLFARDRKLLEARGSLIVRQLCIALSPEDVLRSFAQVLEREADLEFASTMITNLNLILITSGELSDMRKLLRSFEKDGQQLFVDLYRSWCHSAVATFSLCLLAQAYEHGFSLLQTFEDLEITVTLLVQIDKLVQLLESPVFSYLRLQLLEPDRHPFLYKFLYGLLMLLPQSSAFATLRNRLTCVSTLGYMHVVGAPPTTAAAAPVSSKSPVDRFTASGFRRTSAGASSAAAAAAAKEHEGIKWAELLTHFKSVQVGHERARKALYTASRYGGGGSARRAMRSAANPSKSLGASPAQPGPNGYPPAMGTSNSDPSLPYHGHGHGQSSTTPAYAAARAI
ncbi:vacuolar protein 14 C-terminal Fig4p binding-domain-containing protein [Catenaria anguillulae PL171]|uniref:Vacuolar protein 14 C-terminal Fig4p binding-domain-containing protein n=1 Tax=Catenaria anguillulae PL171 TaxID=765915 RepID=A0A1Y2HHN8_9FUNG|nr:vacuolar protein 14 C-terminal Fig4p binding-domain-containing protein [Catenaria anguillulae PL171]